MALNVFKSIPPTYENGSMFLSYRQPAAMTFTSNSPSSDMDAYLQAITGLGGWEQRALLQSKSGTELLSQAASGKTLDNVSYLGSSTYGSRASCQTDSDCPTGNVCYTFNDQVFGPQQGPTCSPTTFPEIMLGNTYNNGKPLRQYSNYCYTDTDCKGVDELTGKPKIGMSCNHFYKGPSVYSQNGLCQVKYQDKGRDFYLQTPPGWVFPLQTPLNECSTQSDCGLGGINGWARCVSGSSDGKKYCVWPGQTYTPTPKQLANSVPRGMHNEPVPAYNSPTEMQSYMLDLQAARASRPSMKGVGGQLTNTRTPPVHNANSLISMSDRQFAAEPQ